MNFKLWTGLKALYKRLSLSGCKFLVLTLFLLLFIWVIALRCVVYLVENTSMHGSYLLLFNTHSHEVSSFNIILISRMSDILYLGGPSEKVVSGCAASIVQRLVVHARNRKVIQTEAIRWSLVLRSSRFIQLLLANSQRYNKFCTAAVSGDHILPTTCTYGTDPAHV